MPKRPLVSVTILALIAFNAQALLAEQPAKPKDFINEVRANFDRWDADHDGVLTADEIEKAVDDPANTGPAAAAVASLRRAIRAHPEISPVTLDRLTAATSATRPSTDRPPAYQRMYESALARIHDTRRELFANTQPHIDALGQGRLGDCFLLAPLGTVAYRKPNSLRQMVTETPDGQVTVQFPGGPKITLSKPTDAEVAIGAHDTDDGVWPNVFEKAIGEVFLTRQKTQRHVSPYSIIGVGGSPHTPLSLLTGHACQRVGCQEFQKGKMDDAERNAKLDEIRNDLINTLRAGRLVVGGTAPLNTGETIVPGLYYNHSYGILEFNRETDVVTFWNPMGNHFAPKGRVGLTNGYATLHGRFDVPLTEAVMWFGAFTFESNQPAEK